MLEEEYAPRRKLPAHLRPAPAPETEFSYEIREAEPADLPAIREIYNHYVLNSTVTFDESPMTLAGLKKKLAKVRELGYPFLVAVNPTGQLLGYAYVTPWKERAGYRFTVESSIYLGPASTGKGLGKVLLGELIDRSKAAGVREMIATIADRGADASLALHRQYGFKEIGHMGRVGYKFGRWLGTVLMQKSLKR